MPTHFDSAHSAYMYTSANLALFDALSLFKIRIGWFLLTADYLWKGDGKLSSVNYETHGPMALSRCLTMSISVTYNLNINPFRLT